MLRRNLPSPKVMLAALAIASAPGLAHAGAVIQYGNTLLGVNDTGELNFSGFHPEAGFFPYGVYRVGVGDAISPGCFCEGWGVSTNYDLGGSSTLTSGFANQSAGSGGLIGGTFASTAGSALSSVNLSGAPVQVTHQFGGSIAPDIFQVTVTIANTGSGTAQDVVYRRAMDWDVPPTEFAEFVTHQGVEANLESTGGNVRFASNNGFASSDPLTFAGTTGSNGPASVNTDFIDLGVDDHGSVFDFAFGDLAVGESRSFNIYYGSAENEAQALARLSQLNPDLYSLGQSSISIGTGPLLDETTGLPLFSEPNTGFSVVVVGDAAVDPSTGLRLFTKPHEGFSEGVFADTEGRAIETFNGLAIANDAVAGFVYFDPATGEVLLRNGFFDGDGDGGGVATASFGGDVSILSAIGTDGQTYVPILIDADGNRYYETPSGDVYQIIQEFFEEYLGNTNDDADLAALVAGLTKLALGPETTLFDMTGFAPVPLTDLVAQETEILTANNDAPTFIFAFGGVGGVELGTTQDNPLLPFIQENPDAIVFEFPAPQPRRWYDPPFADGFSYELVGGGEFTEVGAPTGFIGPFEIYVADVLVDTIAPGESYFFDPGVSKFRLMFVNDDPLDTADPDFATMFPTFLDFDGSPDSLLMTSILVASSDVPEPAAALLLAGGILALGIVRRRRSVLA